MTHDIIVTKTTPLIIVEEFAYDTIEFSGKRFKLLKPITYSNSLKNEKGAPVNKLSIKTQTYYSIINMNGEARMMVRDKFPVSTTNVVKAPVVAPVVKPKPPEDTIAMPATRIPVVRKGEVKESKPAPVVAPVVKPKPPEDTIAMPVAGVEVAKKSGEVKESKLAPVVKPKPSANTGVKTTARGLITGRKLVLRDGNWVYAEYAKRYIDMTYWEKSTLPEEYWDGPLPGDAPSLSLLRTPEEEEDFRNSGWSTEPQVHKLDLSNPIDREFAENKAYLESLGLTTSAFQPDSWLLKVRDRDVNKVLLALGTLWMFYNYPVSIYVVIGGLIGLWILAVLYKYLQLKESLKHEFKYDPKSKYTEEFERARFESMKERVYGSKKKKSVKKW